MRKKVEFRHMMEEDKPIIVQRIKEGIPIWKICRELHITRLEIEPFLLEENLIKKSECKYLCVINNSIKELRMSTGMSQLEFANHYGIPVRTLQEWEQGRSNPPSYLVDLIKRIMELESH